MMYDKLLSEVELNKVKDKFKDDCESSLDEAIRKHVSIYILLYFNHTFVVA